MLQNRVNPWGALCTVPDRGDLMGNRGILHNERKEIVANWRHKHWVTCLLAFKEIQRPKPFSTLDNYSELFFLDEATAFAAGHRPCNYCQRERLTEFKNAWVRANRPGSQPRDTRMDEIDQVLHSERVLRGGIKNTYTAKLEQLPFGTIVEHDKQALLIDKSGLYHWSFSGYTLADSLSPSTEVNVLTPFSIVKSFECGFNPKTAAEAHAQRNGTPG